MAIDKDGVMDRESAKQKPTEHKNDEKGNMPEQIKKSNISESGKGSFPCQ